MSTFAEHDALCDAVVSALEFYARSWTDRRFHVAGKEIRWREPLSGLREDGGQNATRVLAQLRVRGRIQ